LDSRKATSTTRSVRHDGKKKQHCGASFFLVAIAALFLLVSDQFVSVEAFWVQPQQQHQHHRQQQKLYYTSRPDSNPDANANPKKLKTNTNTNMSIKKQRELKFKEIVENSKNDLDILRAQAAKLREEAASLQTTLQESKEAKLQKETDKVDGWIEDLLIQARVGTPEIELLKTVEQVCEVLTEDRYSAEQILKIFKRLCQVREQESRSNCSPLMELLVDATGKLDSKEREDNPNKRWNRKTERVLRKKLFARDWNIQYVSDDELNW